MSSRYNIICLEEVVKIFFEAKRLHSKKWIKDIVGNMGEISIAV